MAHIWSVQTKLMTPGMSRSQALLWPPPSASPASSHTQPEVSSVPGPSPASLSSLPSLVRAAVLEMTVLPPASSAAHCPNVPYERIVWLQAASSARSSPMSSAVARGCPVSSSSTRRWPRNATCEEYLTSLFNVGFQYNCT